MTLNARILVLACLTLVLAGCGEAADRGDKAGLKTDEDRRTTARPAERQPAAPVATAGPTREETLQSCLRQHSEADRRYCECFADQMDDRLGGSPSAEERGRASVAAAMACKGLRAPSP